MRVLIVDDHPVVVTGCRAIFAARPDIETFDVRDGAGGVAAYFEWRPDIALIDVNLPGLSGFEVLKRILERAPDARLISFSMNADPAVAAHALTLGARAYLTKSDTPEQFLAAADALMAGGDYLTTDMAREIAFLNGPRRDAPSPREAEILSRLALGRSVAEIAADLGVAYKTLAGNCATLKAKLGLRTTQDLVRFAVERARG